MDGQTDPSPTGLVVKNGLDIFFICSVRNPGPESLTETKPFDFTARGDLTARVISNAGGIGQQIIQTDSVPR